MTKDHYSIRLDNGLRAALEEWAAEDERSLPWIIHHILRQAVNERRALDPRSESERDQDADYDDLQDTIASVRADLRG